MKVTGLSFRFWMNSSTGVSRRTTASNFHVESLDDPQDEEALDRALGLENEVFSAVSVPRQENHPPTTQKEIWGWYLYEAANQPYSRYVFLIMKLETLRISFFCRFGDLANASFFLSCFGLPFVRHIPVFA